tara:strand:- start:5900 stop:6118 length:219 start_codon:yes stop_codon:yes gene_type:complete
MNYFKNTNYFNNSTKKKSYKRELIYTPEYSTFTTHQRHNACAEKASGKGTDGYCWWIEKWLKMYPTENAFKV